MYNSCKEAHIAVNDKIQQINANRQESIRPQYIDIALNEAIDVLLTQKIKAFEETGRFYDDLQCIKTTYESPLYLPFNETEIKAHEDTRGFIYIPSNYLHGISYDAKVIYDKFQRYRHYKSKAIIYIRAGLKDWLDSERNPYPKKIEPITVIYHRLGNKNIAKKVVTLDYKPTIYNEEGLFEYIQYALNTLNSEGFCVGYEKLYHKDGAYGLIFQVVDPNMDITFEFDDTNVGIYKTTFTENMLCHSGGYPIIAYDNNVQDYVETFEYKSGKYVGMDLVSDVQRKDILQTYHNRMNRHIHPICTIENNMLYVDFDKTFVVTDVSITYLREPRKFNYAMDIATELPFMTEIINLATQKLLGKLKDDGYQIAINESNSLK